VTNYTVYYKPGQYLIPRLPVRWQPGLSGSVLPGTGSPAGQIFSVSFYFSKKIIETVGIILYLNNDFLIDDIEHPNQEKYSGQRMMVFNIEEYIYLVPYIETREEIFLKTIIPSRKSTKEYLENKHE